MHIDRYVRDMMFSGMPTAGISSNHKHVTSFLYSIDIADKIAMLSAIPSTSLSVNTLVSLDEKEVSYENQ